MHDLWIWEQFVIAPSKLVAEEIKMSLVHPSSCGWSMRTVGWDWRGWLTVTFGSLAQRTVDLVSQELMLRVIGDLSSWVAHPSPSLPQHLRLRRWGRSPHHTGGKRTELASLEGTWKRLKEENYACTLTMQTPTHAIDMLLLAFNLFCYLEFVKS